MRVECNITQRCNAICDHCNKAVGVADANTATHNKPLFGDMSLEQMRRAVDQLLEQDVGIGGFTFCGGEPIMHPQLQEMIYEVERLRTERTRWRKMLKYCRILSNGLNRTKSQRDKIKLPEKFVWTVNALDDPDDPLSSKNDHTKRENKRTHAPFWISPADVGMEASFHNCTVKIHCGIGLDATGWSMCGKATMLGTLLGVDPSMKEGNIAEHVNTPIEDICKHCQYGLGGLRGRLGRRGMPMVNKKAYDLEKRYKAGELPAVSETFQKAFDEFNSCGPKIEIEEIAPLEAHA